MYQLGVTLYALLAGRPPFRDKSPARLMQQIHADNPEPPSSSHLGVPAMLEDVVMRLLAKRYVDATALRMELERAARFLNSDV